MDHIELV